MHTHPCSRTLRKALSVSLIAIVCLGASAGSATAKKPSGASSTPSLSAPTSAPVDTPFRVSGSGYDPSKQTWILVETASSRGYLLASVDATGVMTLDMSVAETGTAKLTAQQTSGNRTTTMGTADVSIY